MIRTIARQAGQLATLVLFIAATLTPAQAASAANTPSVVSGDITRLAGTFLTKSRPAALALPQGGTIEFHADTQATLITDPQSLMLLPGMKTATYSVILRKGRVEVILPERKRATVAVAVNTPSGTRIVTTSGYMALSAQGQDVTVVNYSGHTAVAQGTQMLKRLTPGEMRRYVGKSGQESREPLPATVWAGGRRVWVATRDTVQLAGYGWTPVAGASGYTVVLKEPLSGRVLARKRTSEPVFDGSAVALSPGRYEMTIAAVGKEGLASPHGRAIPIRIVGLTLPQGAELHKNDTVTLGPDQLVQLTHAEGLALTTADHRGNVPATLPFGLAGQERASVLIHAPDSGDPAALTLVRRGQLVVAWVGPKTVTWPTSAVELKVSLENDAGSPLSPTIIPAPTVRVGTETVTVDWQKQGRTWHAQLPPRSGKGPWIVRLEVLDQYGIPIGRDFVEVAPAASVSRPSTSKNKPPTRGGTI